MECEFCRAEIPEYAKKCMFCGTNFAEEERKAEIRKMQKKAQEASSWEAQMQSQAIANKAYRQSQEEQLILRVAQVNRTLDTIKSWPVSQCIQHLDSYEQFLSSHEAGIPSENAFGWRSAAQRQEWGFWNYFGEFTHVEKDEHIPSQHFEKEWQAYLSHGAHQNIRDRWHKIQIAQAVREERLKVGLGKRAELKNEQDLNKSKKLKNADFLEYIFLGCLIICIGGFYIQNVLVAVIAGAATVGCLIGWKLLRRGM